ncbi:MAG: DUF1801 domain-containing protein [Chryseolinea sp.]
MKKDPTTEEFLSSYDEDVLTNALAVRNVLSRLLPDVTEQVDRSARMIAYCYGQRYADMVCTIIPSKKGVKLGFYKGVELDDPHKLLEGTGKISRYVQIRSKDDVRSDALKELISRAFKAYLKREK